MNTPGAILETEGLRVTAGHSLRAASIKGNIGSVASGCTSGARKATDNTRFLSSRLPIEPVREMICRDFERGVSPKSLSVMYQTCMDGVFECLRLRMRELEAVMRKPACACGLALAALIGIDAHVAIVADSGATVERVFRGRRGAGRRRGLEDSLVLTQYRQFALIGGC